MLYYRTESTETYSGDKASDTVKSSDFHSECILFQCWPESRYTEVLRFTRHLQENGVAVT